MKNLSVQEKNDLSSCVFQSLGTDRKVSLLSLIIKKIKTIFGIK
ncbi:hypothetical protein [Campylobacter sp. MIT 99-7217]|nr:hypothetical protein [Campylobacter sp. MIT 99-7217]